MAFHTTTLSTAEPPVLPSRAPAPPLRIGLVLRPANEWAPPTSYVRSLCDALLQLDTEDEFVCAATRGELRDRWSERPNVRALAPASRAALAWEPIALPLVARREHFDVVLQHGIVGPWLAPCPAVVLHADHESQIEDAHRFSDHALTLARRVTTPLQCWRAAFVVTRTHAAARALHATGVPLARLRTLHGASAPHFAPLRDADLRERVARRYGLPTRAYFLLCVAGEARGDREILARSIEAHRALRHRLRDCPPLVILGAAADHVLVAGGRLDEFTLIEEAREEDVPAIYSAAHALLALSSAARGGSTMLEGLATGCAAIGSLWHGELAGDAAILVDAHSQAAIAGAMARLVTDVALLADLRRRALARARHFSWDASARRLRELLREAALTGRQRRLPA